MTMRSTPSPCAAALSATTLPSARELLNTATPGPFGRGWLETIWATSMSCSMVSTRITPAWRIIASRASGGACVVRTAWPGGSPQAHRVGLRHDDRLGPGQAPGQPGKLARVADRFQVEPDGGGVGVVLPELHHVVAGDVGAVAGREERGDPDPAPAGGRVEGDADRGRLAEQAQPAAAAQRGRHRGVEGHGRVGVHDAQRGGADHAHAVGAGLPDEFALAGEAAFAVVRVAGRWPPRCP